MTELPQAAKQYLHAVRRNLDAPQKDRERLMERLNRAVGAYAEENEETQQDALIAAFGQPEVCAASLLSEIDPLKVTAARSRKKRLQRVIVGILAVLVMLLAGISLYLYSTGGLVIITHHSYKSTEDLPPPPASDAIVFQYEYEDGD